jgi:hypothetical protein
MGSIDKYSFRTTLASLALIPGSPAGALRIARGERTLGGIDPITGRGWMFPSPLGFDSQVIPALVIGESNARLLRLPVPA